MGRKSVANHVLSWLNHVYSRKQIIFRKFHDASLLFDIYMASEFNNYTKNEIDSKREMLLRGFVRSINNIIRDGLFTQLKSKYIREEGYKYIFLYPHEGELNVSSIRFSPRNEITASIQNKPTIHPKVISPPKETEITLQWYYIWLLITMRLQSTSIL